MVQVIDVNLITVIIAAAANITLGFAWYSKSLLGKAWMREMGFTEASMAGMKQGMGKVYALMTVASLVMAYVLAHIVNVFNATNLVSLALMGVILTLWQ